MTIPPTSPISRHEFDRVITDVEALKTGHTELRTLVHVQSRKQARKGRILKNIQNTFTEEHQVRKYQEAARQHEPSVTRPLKRTV